MAKNASNQPEDKEPESGSFNRELIAIDILNSMPFNIAVLDSKGVIRYVNKSWLDFAVANGLEDRFEGQNYLSICEQATGKSSEEAGAAREGILRVIKRQSSDFQLEYPCHSPEMERWFRMNVTALTSSGAEFVLIQHDLITERKQAQEALRASEKRYRHFFDDDLTADFIATPDGIVIDCNDSFLRMYGFSSKEEIVNSKITMLYPDPSEWNEICSELASTGRLENFEIVRRRRDGKLLNIIENLVAEYDDNGRMILIKGYLFDITERKKAEIELVKERERLKYVIDGTHVGTWEWNVQTGELFTNERWAEIVGYSVDELSPISIETWEMLVHPDDIKISDELLQKHFKGELEYHEVEVRMRHKNGEWVWILDRGRVAAWTDDGKPLLMYGTHQDITGRKRMEDTLRDNEMLFSSLLKYSPIYIFFKDNNIRSLRLSSNYEQMLGMPIEDLLGKSMDELFPSEFARSMVEDDRRILEKGELVTVSEQFDGRYYETIKFPILKEGKPYQLAGFTMDVTERKLVEIELAESEHMFRTVFNESPIGLELYNQDARLIELNKACLDLFGVEDVSQVKGFNLLEDPNIPEEKKILLLKGKQVSYDSTFDFEKVRELNLYKTSRVGKLLIHSQITPLGWNGRKATGGYLAQINDVTEIRRFEEEQEATLNVLRILNSTNKKTELMRSIILYLKNWSGCEAVGIRLKDGDDYPYFETSGFSDDFVLAENYLCARDRDGNIVRDKDFNPVLACMCGNVLCKRFDPALPFFTEHGSFWSNCTTELLATTTEKERQSRTRNRCNGEGYESVALIPLRFGNEIFGLLQMNDRRKNCFTPGKIRTIERLADNLAIGMAQEKSVEMLRESKERLKFVVEGARLGWWDWNIPNKKVSRSQGWADMLEYTYEEAQKPTLFGEITHPDDVEKSHEVVNNHLEGYNPYFEYEVRVRKKSGAYIWVLSRGRIVERDLNGNPVRVSGTILDITERKQLDFEREKASRLESIGLLAGGIAHDFNNILTTALGNLSLAKMMSGKNPEQVNEIINEAETSLLRSKGLTRQLLTFAKGGAPIKKAFCVKNVLENTVMFALRGTKIKAVLDFPDEACVVDADEGQFDQMIGNIVINAVQAMPQGGKIKVSVGSVDINKDKIYALIPGRYVSIRISDSGTGIHPEHIEKVFDPYFTTKQQGSGLGLASSYSIARRHDGHIELESELGKGSSFTIYLPVSSAKPDAMVTSDDTVSLKNGRILVMDDEIGIRTMVGKMLGLIGHEVATAANGEEALKIYEEALKSGNRFDAVILDLTVPGGMGGKDAVVKLAEIDPDVTAIVSSGYSEDPVCHEPEKYGFKAVMSKPYMMQELKSTLQKVMRFP